MTSSPTRMPPVSSAAFHVRPKSLRLIFVLAEIATRVLPQGSFVGWSWPFNRKADFASDAVDGQVAFAPTTLRRPTMLMPVDLKCKVGKLFNIEEIGALEVSIALFIAGVNGEQLRLRPRRESSLRSDSSRNNTPETLENWPFTLAIIMCLTLNSATE